MKKHLLLAALMVFCNILSAQGPHAIWEDQINGGYKYVRFNSITGVKTTIANLPPIVGFVAADASASNYDLNYYHFIAQTNTNKVLYTLNLSNGSVVYSPVITNTVVGIEYNCVDSTLYGIQVNGNLYNLVKLDPVTAGITVIAPISNMQGYVGGTFSLDIAQQIYTVRVLTSTVFKLRSLDIKTGAVLADNTFADNVRGIKYSPTDNKTYGMWDDNGVYKLEEVNYLAGTHSTVASYTVMVPGFYGESTSMSQNGEYTFRGFDFNNNSALFTIDVTSGTVLYYNNTSDNAVGFEEPTCVAVATSANTLTNSANIFLYPNPATNDLTMEATGQVNLMELYDILGNLLLSKKPSAEKEKISVENLSPGSYILRVTGPQISASKKLFIVK